MKFQDKKMTTETLCAFLGNPVARTLFCRKEIEFIISCAFTADSEWNVYFSNENCGYTMLIAKTKIGHVNFDVLAYHDAQYSHIFSAKSTPIATTKHFAKDDYYVNGVQMTSSNGEVYSDGLQLCDYTSAQMEDLAKEIRTLIWGSVMELESGINFENGAREEFAKHPKFRVRWNDRRAVFCDADTNAPFWMTSKVVKIERFGNGYCCLRTASGHNYNITL